jgi:integrase
LRAYFKWLVDNGYAKNNPWRGKTIKRQKKGKPKNARDIYSDHDLLKLLAAKDATLRDFIATAIFSGLRREEAATLTAREIIEVDGILCFDITAGHAKTDASIRSVPVHSSISEMIRQRAKKNGYLFAATVSPKKDKPRKLNRPLGDALGKRFATWKRKVLGKTHPGRFHDLRKAAARRMAIALQAGATGFDHWTVADVLGHDKGSLPLAMTMHTYAGPSSMEARKAAIEAIAYGVGSKEPLHNISAAKSQ